MRTAPLPKTTILCSTPVRKQTGIARDLNDTLRKLERDTWVDWRSIPDTAEWRSEIFAAIEAAHNFLFIISPDSLSSKMCRLEVAHAVANNKRIVTILHRPLGPKDKVPAGRARFSHGIPCVSCAVSF